MGHAPPVARLSLAFGAGAAWTLVGLPWWPAAILGPLFLASPIHASARPVWAVPTLLLGAVAGALAAAASPGAHGACEAFTTGRVVEGRFLAAPRSGSAPFLLDGGCGPYTVVVDGTDLPAGRLLALRGRWREGRVRPWFMAAEEASGPSAASGPSVASPADRTPRWVMVRWRDGLVERLEGLYGPRAPFVAALTLARREGFDPELRSVFARTGLAHLLAISGFHVGVIAGLAGALLRLMGLGSRGARLGAAGGAWLYVAFIGFPDAACRAALILAFLAAARLRGRPPARWGALAAAFLVLVVLDPTRVGSAGFQLSFAGAAGLVAWARPLRSWIHRRTWRALPDPFVGAVASGVAATAATIPIVAWHFEEVSAVGVPATLVGGPLVAVALPGAIASLALDFVAPGAAAFLAGGVSVLLQALEQGARTVASWSWSSVWATRATVWAMAAGIAVAHVLARRPWVGARSRRLLAGAYVSAMVAGWPLLLVLQGRGTLELLALDVGQGDATALRTPGGRWVLVDAGPPARGAPAAGHPVVRALRARGVGRLSALVLTHADLDHVGGAADVLTAMAVDGVYDPGVPEGKPEFVDVLRAALVRDVPWIAARAGDRIEIDGITLDVLSPTDSLVATGAATNEASIVVRVRYGAFDALLTGDAYRDQERAFATGLQGDIEVLKVGHHGSQTSTDDLLLERARPSLALISAGRGNRYGHPHPDVLARLRRHGVSVRRTDLEGTLRVLAREDGSYAIAAWGR